VSFKSKELVERASAKFMWRKIKLGFSRSGLSNHEIGWSQSTPCSASANMVVWMHIVLDLRYQQYTFATWNSFVLRIKESKQDKQGDKWTTASLLIVSFLFIHIHASVGGGKESVCERANALCRCPYTDDRKSLKGRWTFHDVVTDVTTFLNNSH
jgi:hypothetical protein